jgi:hypothetical protein
VGLPVEWLKAKSGRGAVLILPTAIRALVYCVVDLQKRFLFKTKLKMMKKELVLQADGR